MTMTTFQYKQRVQEALEAAIVEVCRDMLPYGSCAEVDGIVCFTLDNNQDCEITLKVHKIIDDRPRSLDSVNHFIGANTPNIPMRLPLLKSPLPLPFRPYKRKFEDGQHVPGYSDKSGIFARAQASPPGNNNNNNNSSNNDNNNNNNNNNSNDNNNSGHGMGLCITSIKSEPRDTTFENDQQDMCDHQQGMDTTGTDLSLSPHSDESNKADVSPENTNNTEFTSTSNKPKNGLINLVDSYRGLREALQEPPIPVGVNGNEPMRVFQHSSGGTLTINTDVMPSLRCTRCSHSSSSGEEQMLHNFELHSLFTCAFCMQTLTSRPNLERHERLHTGQKPYACTQCDMRFSRKDDLKGHVLKHEYEKQYRCNRCQKGYTDRSCLRNHFQSIHGTNLCDICPRCGEGFDNVVESMDHKRCHKELESFRCNICIFIGTNGLALEKHLLVHSNPNKQYRCIICSISFEEPFAYSGHLRGHRLEHVTGGGFACCFCDLKLSTYEQFVKHEHAHIARKHGSHLNHDHQKQYMEHQSPPISDSDNTATDIANFDRENNEYWCTGCNEGFQTESAMDEHIRSQHPNEHGSSTDMRTNATVNPGDIGDDYEDNDQVIDYSLKPDRPATMNNFHNQQPDTLLERSVLRLEKNFTRNSIRSPTLLRKSFTSYPRSLTPENHALTNGLGCGMIPRTVSDAEASPERYGHEDMNHRGNEKLGTDMGTRQIALGSRTSSSHSSMEDGSGDSSGFSVNFSDTPLTDRFPGAIPTTNGPIFLSGMVHPRQTGILPPAADTHIQSSGGDRRIPNKLTYKGPNFSFGSNFVCVLCDSTNFDTYTNYSDHTADVHKRFLCEYCGKRFTAKPNRDRHVRYHTGKRPYRCDLCNQAFFRGDDLKYHRTTRHADVRPYHCTSCSQTFSWQRDLDRHARGHII